MLQQSDGKPCALLEIAPSRKLVWTVALRPGYRPSDPSFDVPTFTAIFSMEPHGKGTKDSALAMHKYGESPDKQERIGFGEGWGRALDQLVAYAKTMPGRAGRHREQSVKKFSPTLRSISRCKRRINLIFSVLFKLILDPGG